MEHYLKLLTIFTLAVWNFGKLAEASFFYLQQAHGHYVWDIYIEIDRERERERERERQRNFYLDLRSAGRMEQDSNFDVEMEHDRVSYVGRLFQDFRGLFSLQLVVLVVVAGLDMAWPLADIGRRSEAALQLSERLPLRPRKNLFPT